MTVYNGQALIIAEDDTEVPVTANLKSGRDRLRSRWRGTLTPGLAVLSQLANLTKARLRLPDGAEAEFLRPDTSDWVHSRQLAIIGQDEPPF